MAKAPGKKKSAKALPPGKFTDVITGVTGASVVIHGHLPRTVALARARQHFEMAAARAHAALEALDSNRFAVRYREGLNIVEGEDGGNRAKASA